MGLPATPLPEVIGKTTEVWIDVIAGYARWTGDDLPRLEAAFITLEKHAERWPVPKHFLDAIPKLGAVLALERKITDEERAAGKAALGKIMGMLKHKGMPK